MSIDLSHFSTLYQGYTTAKAQEISVINKKIMLLTNKLRKIYIAAITLLTIVGIFSCGSLILAILSPTFPLIFALLCISILVLVCITISILRKLLAQLKLLPAKSKTLLAPTTNYSQNCIQIYQDAAFSLTKLINHQQSRLESLNQSEKWLLNQLTTLSLQIDSPNI